ncbi:Flp pilus assembly protein CpaB [Marinovum sp. 2_MG-2023]|uniref:Flp pilus assembly protein CpaB n=1 Tax=Roseobacteraceae TaxID=2854170 RepID=UPI001FD083FC|nr:MULTISPECIES: Flp pilus assembly protein CpaB [Roseobacteraceae]MCJ7873019.1 Flp pilus assembly protein CpaB [Phaeobacter sp. J2-8]MDO6731673.1 Flp pilus assembly protein CpaB [Marinovum sp. 2_MG-2023]MDO6780925.1 Flp pilus assembly protein CpaB [Marinovum sp. 1_MG-2023]
MRMVFGLVLLLGIGLAGFAVYLANGYVNSYRVALAKAQSSESVATIEVFVATERLNYGDRLEKSKVRVVKFPRAAVPEGTFLERGSAAPYSKPWDELDEDTQEHLKTLATAQYRPKRDGLRIKDIPDLFPDTGEERYVLRSIEKGEAIIASKVTEPGQDAGITSRLGDGMQAFSIKVDVASGVSGFLRPGDRIAVYWTGRVSSFADESARGSNDVTKLIESGVKLIAVDQSAYGDKASTTIARTVTVSARPQQVAALAQAQSTGRLSLALVGAGDTSEVGPVEVDQMSLLGLTAPVPQEVVEVEREQICTIRTRKGGEMVEIPIPCTN